ncbi:GFA family protein [Phenylobacterium aquaticum]|uniref:GFA family protein n=1 Tax=Phenylobacterium aquaticum TaxID=1763816 RepID=UPI0026F040F4|nr:GFA family protein [Phenylobacterium aquaticum]
MTTGSCLCGSIRFEITGALPDIQVCHCGACRKAQGGPFATNLPVTEANFRFTSGQETLRAYESSPGKERLFCGQCGSPMFSRTAAIPGVVRVRAGTLDAPVAARPAVHNFVGSKADWWEITDALPQHLERKPG